MSTFCVSCGVEKLTKTCNEKKIIKRVQRVKVCVRVRVCVCACV